MILNSAVSATEVIAMNVMES